MWLTLGLLLAQGASAVIASSSVVLDENVRGFHVTPDGSRVVYLAGGEMRSIPIGGGSPLVLDSEADSEEFYDYYRFSPDGSLVVYYKQKFGVGSRIKRASTGGPEGSSAYLSPATDFGGITAFSFSPDSSRVVYQVCLAGGCEIDSVSATGTWEDSIRINADLPAWGNLGAFLITPDSTHVVYAVDQETDGVYELWMVPIAGPPSSAVKISGSVVENGSIDGLDWGWFSPDGGRIAYLGNIDQANVTELYSSPVPGTGGESHRISPELIQGIWEQPVRTTDGERSVFLGRVPGAQHPEIWSVPSSGPSADAVSLTGEIAGYYARGVPSPDGANVAILGSVTSSTKANLYTVPMLGPSTELVQLDSMLGEYQYVSDFRFAHDSSFVAFAVEGEKLESEGYRAAADGSSSAEKIWSKPCSLQNAPQPVIAIPADDRGFVFGCQDFTGKQLVTQLWLARLKGAADVAPMLLAESFDMSAVGSFENGFEISADGEWIVFVARGVSGSYWTLTARHLPFFWDGFESGSSDNWVP